MFHWSPRASSAKHCTPHGRNFPSPSSEAQKSKARWWQGHTPSENTEGSLPGPELQAVTTSALLVPETLPVCLSLLVFIVLRGHQLCWTRATLLPPDGLISPNPSCNAPVSQRGSILGFGGWDLSTRSLWGDRSPIISFYLALLFSFD